MCQGIREHSPTGWVYKEPASQARVESSDFRGGNYPARACAVRGYVIGRGLYIHICLQKKFHNFLNLSKYSLSEVHSNTGRLLVEFNRLQYTLAAPEVFVAFANPVCLPSWYRVSIVRNTNIDRLKSHPYGIVDTVEHAYSTILYC